MSERTLVVVCADWPAVAFGAEGGNVPVAVVAANRVVACSAGARVQGVRVGQRRRQAESHSPNLTVVAADHTRDMVAFEPVVSVIERFTPRVEVVQPGVCAFATRGPSRYFGGDLALAEAVRAEVMAVMASSDSALSEAVNSGSANSGSVASAPLAGVAPRVGVSVGVADGLFVARLAAARATRRASGVLVVPAGGSAGFLAPQPLSRLAATEAAGVVSTRAGSGRAAPGNMAELVDLLGRLGLRTLGDLGALPAPTVAARFGPLGVLAHRLARGLDPRPLAARTPPLDLAVTVDFDEPVDNLETLAFVARSLAERFQANLAEKGLASTRVRIEFDTGDGQTRSRLWRNDPGLPSTSLAERVRWQIEGWLTAGPGPNSPDSHAGQAPRATAGLTRLRLIPDDVGPDRGVQPGFWGADRAAADRAARALVRVQGVLGPESVCAAVPIGARAPGEQMKLVAWDAKPAPTGPASGGGSESGGRVPAPTTGGKARRSNPVGDLPAPWPGRLPPPGPATVFPKALAAEMLDESGTAVEVSGRGVMRMPPRRLLLPGTGALRSEDIESWAGPWPVAERWWNPSSARRRARCQVITSSGVAYLMVLEGRRWWVEAVYD